MNPIPNILDNNYHRKSTSSHKINSINLNENVNDQTLVHKSIPIISSGNQKTTIFDNVTETSFSEDHPYVLIDSNRSELDNMALSELNIIPFSKDSFNEFSFSEQYIRSYIKSINKFKVKLNNFIVPYKFKGINTLELRFISLHIQNVNTKTNQVYGTSNITGGLLKCVPLSHYISANVKFIEFKCNESPIINLNIKDDINIQLFDPDNNILEPYEDEHSTIINPNNNIQTSITLELIPIDTDTNKKSQQITNNPSNKPTIPSIDIGLNVPTVKSSKSDYRTVNSHNTESQIKSEEEPIQSSESEEEPIQSNLDYDPKLEEETIQSSELEEVIQSILIMILN